MGWKQEGKVAVAAWKWGFGAFSNKPLVSLVKSYPKNYHFFQC